MSVDKDDTMHSTAEDAEFAALMAASSLGAPHVQTCATGMDEGTRGRLRDAVAATDDATPLLLDDGEDEDDGEALDVAAAAAPRIGAEADGATSTGEGAVSTSMSALASELRELRSRYRLAPGLSQIVLIGYCGLSSRDEGTASVRRRILALLAEQVLHDGGGASWRYGHPLQADRGDGVLLLVPRGPVESEAYVSLVRGGLRGAVRDERPWRRRFLWTAGEAALPWPRRADWPEQPRPEPDYLLHLGHGSWNVEAKDQPPACLDEGPQRLLLEVCKCRKAPGRLSEPQSARGSAMLPGADPALAVRGLVVRALVSAGMIPQACLTDLLHAPPPARWVRPQLAGDPFRERNEAFAWPPGRPADGWRSLPGWNALTMCEGREGTGLFEARPETLPDLTLPSASLLVAAELAVDLGGVHRQSIPAQASTPPNLDEYTVWPGSSILVPRAERTGFEPGPEPSRRGPDPVEGEGLVEGAGELLWSKKGKEGGEHRARLWMRVHFHEGDTGERLPVTMICSQADRHAITVVFYAGTDDEVRWTFARELLADGLHNSVGIGDVIVWPTAPNPVPEAETGKVQRVHVRLRSPEGTALLSVARPDITAFLEISEPLVSSVVTETDGDYLKVWERELAELICPHVSE
ncbi:SsgA family sporulation/cell division regulator [Streptomyces sp. NPDC097617]|uniref:SsgA family sporulation/cell division regulator n=1 Tax=Streptomyces sp. NPDC097617 TaxID=3366091 RepID=UPI003827C27C